MELLSTVLPIILYIVAIVLLVILIILGLRLIKVLDNVDRLVGNLEEKVDAFNGAINLIGKAGDTLNSVSDSLLVGVTSFVTKILGKRKNKMKEEEEEEYYE